jgi:hypothetical protein
MMSMGKWEPAPKPVEDYTPEDWKLVFKGIRMMLDAPYSDCAGVGLLRYTETTALMGGSTTEYTGDYPAIQAML